MTSTPQTVHGMPPSREVRPDIWARVLWFLHREKPSAMSRPIGRDMKQGDLAAAMRVCSTLYDLAVPLLYTSIISDNLNALLYAHPRGSCSGRVAGKASLLGRIRHLYLEHTDKSHIPLGDVHTLNTAYHTELVNLHCGLTNRVFTALHGPFPNLETLALGSISGPPDRSSWDAFCRTGLDPTRGRMLREISEAMPRLLASPRLQHVCQRGGGGMLNFPALLEDPPPILSSATFCTHIAPGEEYWSLSLGRPCRWILDASPPFFEIRQAVESVLSMSSSMRPWAPASVDQRIMLDIYASGTEVAGGFDRRVDESLPPGWRWEGSNAVYWDCVEAKDTAKVVREIVGGMGGFGAGKDVIRWFSRSQAGICGSCER